MLVPPLVGKFQKCCRTPRESPDFLDSFVFGPMTRLGLLRPQWVEVGPFPYRIPPLSRKDSAEGQNRNRL